MNRLVLLDRDGTINVEKYYLSSPEQVELLPGAAEGIRRLTQAGLIAVVVTNQSAIGRHFLRMETLEQIHARMQGLLMARGAVLHAIYVCPHRPDEGCACRKPAPALARRAAEEFGADLSRSFVVGDKACDIGLGKGVGAKTILVRTGYGAALEREGTVQPDWVTEDLPGAAELIRLALANEMVNSP
jgi:D-glycero-D-manno-heptose 1,7-bisphosphate phosphatase